MERGRFPRLASALNVSADAVESLKCRANERASPVARGTRFAVFFFPRDRRVRAFRRNEENNGVKTGSDGPTGRCGGEVIIALHYFDSYLGVNECPKQWSSRRRGDDGASTGE